MQHIITDLFMHIYQRRPSYAELKQHMHMSYDAVLDKTFAEHIISCGSIQQCEEPMIFIPRDAGFFSVFNYYIGLIYIGIKAYPLYNRQLFLTHNGDLNKHFCYWTQEENAWMSYLSPIVFHEGDDTHVNIMNSISQMKITKGEQTPCEIRNPYFTKLLMTKKELWEIWRYRMNTVYTRYIHFSDKLSSRVDTFWNANVNKEKEYVIGIHYRHPSHHVESGRIYPSDYYQEVKKITTLLPDKDKDVKIFIASDNDLGIMAFNYYFDCFYMSDVERCSLDSVLEWAFARGDGGKSDAVDFIDGVGYQYHYQKCANNDYDEKHGADVICETLALSRCDYVVHGISNIALAVSYINPHVIMHPILPK